MREQVTIATGPDGELVVETYEVATLDDVVAELKEIRGLLERIADAAEKPKPKTRSRRSK